MATYTWADFTFLTAQQQAGLQAFFDLGKELQAKGHPTPPKPGVPPIPTANMTLTNGKRAGEILRDINALWEPTKIGVQYSNNYHRAVDQEEFETANP